MLEVLILLLVPYLLFLLLSICVLWQCLGGNEERGCHAGTERSLADDQAEALLREMLSEKHYQQWVNSGYLEVVSPSIAHRTYRIPSAGGLVKVYERGRIIMELCLQPVEPLPEGDVVLMHKLMIEANEQEYLQTANQFVRGALFRHG
jgi:hypothetical protein